MPSRRSFPRCASLALLAAAALGASLMGASPAQAKPIVVSPAWSPLNRPADIDGFSAKLDAMTYAMTCGDVSATGWSADIADDPDAGWSALLVTTHAVISACAGAPGALDAAQGDVTYAATPDRSDPSVGVGLALLPEDLPYLDWDYVPQPRLGQWVGIGARSADGAPLPMLKRRVATVDINAGTFTVDAPIDASYVGAPVVDNTHRALGVVTTAGTVVTGAPQLCATLIACDDPSRVWWDITAPSAVRKLIATPGKRSVTFTWRPAASDGGAPVAYWYRVGDGDWRSGRKFTVTVKAPKGQRVIITVSTVNLAGPGPTLGVSARARQ